MVILDRYCVDSGILMVASVSFLESLGAKIDVTRSIYNVVTVKEDNPCIYTYFLEQDEDDKEPTVSHKLDLKKGDLLFIGDPGYAFSEKQGVSHDTWLKALEKTRYFRDKSNKYCKLSSIGDGRFALSVEIDYK